MRLGVLKYLSLSIPVLLCMAGSIVMPARAEQSAMSEMSGPEQAMLSEAFEVLHRVGEASNGGQGGDAAMREGCNVPFQNKLDS